VEVRVLSPTPAIGCSRVAEPTATILQPFSPDQRGDRLGGVAVHPVDKMRVAIQGDRNRATSPRPGTGGRSSLSGNPIWRRSPGGRQGSAAGGRSRRRPRRRHPARSQVEVGLVTVVGVAKLVSSKTRIVEVDGPMGARTSKLYYAEYGGHRPASVGFSIKKTGQRLVTSSRRAPRATGCWHRWPSPSCRSRTPPPVGWSSKRDGRRRAHPSSYENTRPRDDVSSRSFNQRVSPGYPVFE
jgi:hypothetical protein